MSGVGKSIISAALCRIFSQDGYKAAPFKSQNMALNSYITKEGLEMGRAQAVQAQAAGIEPSALMNPILLKPTTDSGSQVIVNGTVRADMSAADYFRYKKRLIPDIMRAYNTLCGSCDIIVIEGAGSPAEINLKKDDIVNMGMAEMADAPVLLVGDIDRGGVFAQLYGTVSLLDSGERKRVKGTIINKFRGDINILKPGLDMIESLTGAPIAGVVPYGDFNIDDEDSLSELLVNKRAGMIDIAVIYFPRISNFTDMNAFECIDGVSVRYIKNVREMGSPDMIILPGSKSVVSDLLWMRKNGLEAAVKKAKCPVFGICGGYQMMGEYIADAEGAEGGKSVHGMEMLPMTTEFHREKIRSLARGVFTGMTGTLKPLDGAEYEGYEIHMGQSIFGVPENKREVNSEGERYGTYIHGIFDKCAARVVKCLCGKKGVDIGDIKNIDMSEIREREYNRLADMARESLNMDLIYKILNKEV